MRVTDEMLDVAQDTYDVLADRACERHAIGKALEAAIQAAWVKFDINDESTYPPIASGYGIRSIRVITNGGDICQFIHSSKQWVYLLNHEIDLITHWMPLPEFKGD